VQAAVAIPFRLAEVSPPRVLYAAGDGVVVAMRSVQRGVKAAIPWTRYLRQVGRKILLVVLLAGAVWWNQLSCWPGPAAPDCQRPLARVAQAGSGVGNQLWQWFQSRVPGHGTPGPPEDHP
jgi:hypothetical protein